LTKNNKIHFESYLTSKDEAMKKISVSNSCSYKVNSQDLSGPFSPFSFALQNIRNKLTTRRDNHNVIRPEDIDLEYLQHIISLSVPLSNSNSLAEAYIQFPIAACWRGGSKKPLICYSGQYDGKGQDNEAVPEQIDETAYELKEVSDAIKAFIINKKLSSNSAIEDVCIQDIIGQSRTIITQYPQSLRKINGFFKVKSDSAAFYVFVTCQPVDGSKICVLSESNKSTSLCDLLPSGAKRKHRIKDCCQEVIKAFKKGFLSNHSRDHMDIISSNSSKISFTQKKDNQYYKNKSTEDYPILREILSNIQENAVKLIRLPNISKSGIQCPFDVQKRRTFSTVFVLPCLSSKGRLCFRYILTHDQSQLLRNIEAKQFEMIINKIEKRELKSLVKEIGKSELKSLAKEIRKVITTKDSNFRNIVEIIKKYININQTWVTKDAQNREVEEYLRSAILSDYTFREESRSVFLKKDLATYMNSKGAIIEYGQAFLLDQILKVKHPDVMMSMINHPFSKLIQFPTSKLLTAYDNDYSDKTFYPAGLNLLEMFFLRSPLFLHPIYQYDVPILLCAFDATLYSGHWQALKGIVEAHTDGIFASILGHEQNESIKFFDKSPNIRSMNIDKSADEFADKLSNLMLRFCPDMDAFVERENRPKIENDHKTRKPTIRIPDEKSHGSIRLPGFEKKIILPNRIANKSITGNRHFEHYIKMYLDDFLGSWSIAEAAAIAATMQKSLILHHGTKAAVAAIMGRNMAHNISSHVLSYWIAHLERGTKTEGESDPVKASKSLFGYLKLRMDFIAEITTTTPAWEKSFRLTDIIKYFTNQFAVLDNIARSEGFCYGKECFKCFKTRTIDCCDGCPRRPMDAEYDKEPEPLEIEYDEKSKVNVSIPHGPVGRHAFYSILENFIRNSAKHGGKLIRDKIKANRTINKSLKFTISVGEDDNFPHYWAVTISDNIGNCRKVIDDKIRERVVDKLNNAIESNSYILSDGQVERGNWGIKEMKISANFLRKNDVSALVDEQEPPLAVMECHKECPGEDFCVKDQNVQLTIYLRKPQEVCIIVKNEEAKDGCENINYGIDCCTINDEIEMLNQGKTISHRFVLFNGLDHDTIKIFIESYRDQIPFRIISCNQTSYGLYDDWIEWHKPVIIKELAIRGVKENPNKFVLDLYRSYEDNRFEKDVKIVIQSGSDTIEKAWQFNGLTCLKENKTCHSKLIVFDNHGVMINEHFNNTCTKYYQKTSGGNLFGKIIKNNPPSDLLEKELMLRELYEAALTKVTIIDERIWNNSQYSEATEVQVNGKAEYQSNKYTSHLEKMGIHLVPVVGGRIGDVDRQNLITNDNPKDAVDAIHCLIIHRGIIDKMGNELLDKIINNKKKYTFVLIDSGRGAPEKDNFLQGTRYIPISALEQFIQDGDKHALVQTIFSIRRTS
jgi:hypothetical protein